MVVLLMGFRLGAVKVLEQKNLPHFIWTEKPLKNPRNCEGVINESFPSEEAEFEKHYLDLKNITHVIAVTEAAVIPASKIRKWLNLYRNKDSVITRCTDKLEMKNFLFKKKVPMTKYMSSQGKTAREIIDFLGLPLVNKVKLSSGGRGVRFLKTENEVSEYINEESYFEKIIKGTEGSIESFVKDGEIVFSNITQYYKNGVCNIIPGGFSKEVCEKIHKLNRSVIKGLKLKWGMTHLEYFITDNQIYFGEVALRPPGGYIMEVLGIAYDQNFWDLFIDIELNNKPDFFNDRSKYTSSIVIHPGAGKVSEILGKDIVKGLESYVKLKLKVKVGDITTSRDGVGEDYGYLFLSNKNRDKLNNDIDTFFSQFKINLN